MEQWTQQWFLQLAQRVRLAEQNEDFFALQARTQEGCPLAFGRALHPIVCQLQGIALQMATHALMLQAVGGQQVAQFISLPQVPTVQQSPAFPVHATERPATEGVEEAQAAENTGRGSEDVDLQPRPPMKKPRIRRVESAKKGSYTQSDQLATICELWAEYAHGLNGGPAVRDLEAKDTSWRNSSNAARKFYNNRKPIYKEIERLIDKGNDEDAAVQVIEALHASFPRKGKRSRHSFVQLGEALKEFHLLHGYSLPYPNSEKPNKADKSNHLGSHQF
jgi:hypothetical protein